MAATPPAPEPDELDLPLARLRLRFKLHAGPALGGFSGGAWRGGLGHALRAACCRTGAPTCDGCGYLRGCDYSLAFETPTPPEAPALATTDAVPHPFGLVALPDEGGAEELLLTLYGSGIRFLAPLVQALLQAGRAGIGPERSSFQLSVAECERPPGSRQWQALRAAGAPEPSVVIPAPLAACQVRLITPLRLRRRGVYLGPADFAFADLFGSLLRRISLLCSLYARPLLADFAGLMRRAQFVTLARTELRWREWRRRSARQGRSIAVGGLLGEFSMDELPAEFWPYLWLGQFVQAGKGTAMGMGYYEIASEATSL